MERGVDQMTESDGKRSRRMSKRGIGTPAILAGAVGLLVLLRPEWALVLLVILAGLCLWRGGLVRLQAEPGEISLTVLSIPPVSLADARR